MVWPQAKAARTISARSCHVGVEYTLTICSASMNTECAPPATGNVTARSLWRVWDRRIGHRTAQADAEERDNEEAAVDDKETLPADEHSPKGAEPGEAPLDGLLTNDKFCLTRTAMLPLSWSRQPLRLRTVSLQNRGSVHAGGTDEAHAHVERPTPANSAQRRADSLGSSLSAPAAVDDRSRGSSDSARPSAGGR
jgi:hypothetical protein